MRGCSLQSLVGCGAETRGSYADAREIRPWGGFGGSRHAGAAPVRGTCSLARTPAQRETDAFEPENESAGAQARAAQGSENGRAHQGDADHSGDGPHGVPGEG